MKRQLLGWTQQVCRRSSTAPPERWVTARPYEQMPGPKPLPLIGNTWRFLPVVGDLYGVDTIQLLSSYNEKYGPIAKLSRVLGKKDIVFLYDPRDIEMVYRNEGRWPIRDTNPSITYYRTVYKKDFYNNLGGVAVVHGEKWQYLRSKLNPIMMQPRSVKLYITPIDKVAQDFVARMRDLRDDKGELPADFINEIYKWGLESISLVALDTRLGCLEPDLKPGSEPEIMIKAVNTIFECLFELDLQFSLWRLYPTPAWKRLVEANDVFNRIAMKYVNAAVERIAQAPKEDPNECGVLERLLTQEGDPKLGILMALDMMVAGIDTTSHSVANILYYLAANQEAQEKLYQEIKTNIPDSRPITDEDLEKMKYLRACKKEAFRMTPVAVGNLRENTKDHLVLGNYRIPKGVNLLMCHMHLSNKEEHYPDPKKYRPERWMKVPGGRSEAQKTNPFVTMPFGFGPRMCVGRRFAELEMSTLLIRIFQNFRLEYHYGELKHDPKVLLYVAIPLKFKLIERK